MEQVIHSPIPRTSLTILLQIAISDIFLRAEITGSWSRYWSGITLSAKLWHFVAHKSTTYNYYYFSLGDPAKTKSKVGYETNLVFIALQYVAAPPVLALTPPKKGPKGRWQQKLLSNPLSHSGLSSKHSGRQARENTSLCYYSCSGTAYFNQSRVFKKPMRWLISLLNMALTLKGGTNQHYDC
jgi:hypothetical protein